MDEMLKVNRELIDWNITEEDIDTLLNIDCYYPAKDNAAGIIHMETEMDELLSMIYVTCNSTLYLQEMNGMEMRRMNKGKLDINRYKILECYWIRP